MVMDLYMRTCYRSWMTYVNTTLTSISLQQVLIRFWIFLWAMLSNVGVFANVW